MTLERFKSHFLARIEVLPNGCWRWTGPLFDGGYGQCWYEGRPQLAHRVSFQIFKGLIPADRPILDHTCHKPEECAGGRGCPHRGCVNPDHVEPSTEEENTSPERGHSWIGRERLVTHCPQGHAYDEVNTKIVEGRRKCRQCRRERERRRSRRGLK